MPLPPGVNTVTVSAGEPLTLPDGTVMKGRLLFTGPDLVTIGAQDVILGGTVEVPLVDGEFTTALVATDVTGMSPSDWTYRVEAVLSNAPGWVRYISLPKATPAVVLADVIVPDPVAGTFTVLADAASLLAKAQNLDDLPDKAQARANLGLALYALLTGATFSGNVTVQGYTTLQGGQFNSDFAAFGDMSLIGSGKAYRLRRGGGGLDFEGGGADMILSVWSAGDFTGAQHSYIRFSADAQNVQVAGKVEFVDALYGATKHTLDGAANKVGFFGATPVARPTVMGSRGGNAALASLLTALAGEGLIVDGTSA